MKTIIPDVSIRSIASWLPSNKIPLSSFAEQYGEKRQEMLSVQQELNGFTEPMRIRNHPICASTLPNI